jgi:predicted DNA-binding transcriptional regulator YafY
MQDDGSYILHPPYSDTPELLTDILKYGADCDVWKSSSLRTLLRELLAAAVDCDH